MKHKKLALSFLLSVLMLMLVAGPIMALEVLDLIIPLNSGSLEVTPSSQTINVGDSATYEAWYYPTKGDAENVTATCSWSIADPSIATQSGSGQYQGSSPGSTTVQASSKNLGLESNAADLIVNEPQQDSGPVLIILPDTADVGVGDATQYRAYLRYSNGDPDVDVTDDCTWGIVDPIASMTATKGEYVGETPGATEVNAHYVRNSQILTAYFAPLDLTADATLNVLEKQKQVRITLEVTPPTASIMVGDNQQYIATLHYSDGTADQDVTDVATWSLSTAIADAIDPGQYKGTVQGTATVTAKYTPPDYGELSDDAILNVLANQTQVRITLEVTPPTASIMVGESQQYLATLHYSDGSADQNVTDIATWSLSAAIADAINPGRYKGTVQGTATVTAKYTPPDYSELSDDATLIVDQKIKDDDPPPTEKLPDGKMIDRQPGYITLCDPQNLGTPADEFTMSYDASRMDSNPDRHPKVFYWNATYQKWVALASYPINPGTIKALNDGHYSGWFVVMGCIQPNFTDVYGNWAEKYANRMNGLGLLEGYPDPDNPSSLTRPAGLDRIIIRSELTATVARILGLSPGDTHLYPTIIYMSAAQNDAVLNSHYADADEIMPWARPYIAAMTQAELVNGKGNGFAPNDQLTRIEAAVIISNALRDVPGFGTAADLAAFSDYDQIPTWAIGKVAQGTINGYPDGSLRPNQPITRAEAESLLLTLLRGLGW